MNIRKRIAYKELEKDINNMTYNQHLIFIKFILKKMKDITIEREETDKEFTVFTFDLAQFEGKNLAEIEKFVEKFCKN